MSLLIDTPSSKPTRAEARTAAGWQRFDRAALIGVAVLTFFWIVTWIAAGVTAPDDIADQPALNPAQTSQTDSQSDDAAQATGVEPTTGDAQASTSDRALAELPENAGAASAPETVAGPVAESALTPPDNAQTSVADDAASARADTPVAASQSAPAANAGPSSAAASSVQTQVAEATSVLKPPFAERMPDAGPTATARPLPVPTVGQSAVRPEAKEATGNVEPAIAGIERIPTQSSGPISAKAPPSENEGGAQVALLEPILELRAADGRLLIDGILGDEQSRSELVRAALKVYGMRNLTDRLAVSAGVAPFEWGDRIEDLMVLLDGPESTLRVRVTGSMVTLSGEVETLDDKLAKGLQAQQLFGTRAIVDNRIQFPDAPVAQLRPANDDGDALAATIAAASAGSASDNDDTNQSGSNQTESVPATTSKSDTDTTSSIPPDRAAAREVAPPEPDVPENAEGGRAAAVGEIRAQSRGAPDKFRLNECARVVTGVYITFDSASARLHPPARAILDDIVPCLSRRAYVIGGHTDNRGDGRSNRQLALLRAEAVKAYLVEANPNLKSLTVVGHGEAKPVASNRSKGGRARNRRVDFRLSN